MNATLPALLGWALIAAPPPAAAARIPDEQLLREAKVGKDTPALLAWLRCQTLTSAQRKRLRLLVPRLGSDDYATREAASQGILELGPAVLASLRRALPDPDEEINDRLRRAIAALEPGSKPAVTAAVARLLRNRPGADAFRALFDCLPEVDGEAEEEVAATIAVLAVEEGKVAGVISEGLRDAEASRRAVAALVLGRSGSAEQQAAVRSVFSDADFWVRFRAAQGLVARRDPAALSVLAALVGEAPAPVALRADELLAAVARQHASRLLWADEPVARRRCRSAWENWERFFGRSDLKTADVDLPTWNRTLQAAAVSRSLYVALMKLDREAFTRLTAVPFLGPNDTTLPRPEMVDTALAEFSRRLGQEVLVPPPALVVRFFEPVRPTASPAARAFLARVPRAELRGVRLAWKFPEPGRVAQEIVLIARTSGGHPQVIALDLAH
jgi:hypothetical protein